jgi:hypothetical protein
MVNYTEIQGQNILIVSSDPSNPIEGQIWYNSTSNTLKGYTLGTASWATAANLPSGIGSGGASGTATAALSFGGNATVPATGSVATNSFNGTSWTSYPNMNRSPSFNAFGLRGTGASTSTLASGGGDNVTNAESFNGSSWTNQTAMPVGIRGGGSFGTSISAAVRFAGLTNPGNTPQPYAYHYNGSSWTQGGAMTNVATSYTGTGPSTAGLASGGSGTLVEAYNGSIWTTKSSMPLSKNTPGMSGNSSNALAFGGDSSPNAGLLWNGTSWATDATMVTARSDSQMNVSNAPYTTGLYIGGFYPASSGYNNVENYTGAALTTKTITTS